MTAPNNLALSRYAYDVLLSQYGYIIGPHMITFARINALFLFYLVDSTNNGISTASRDQTDISDQQFPATAVNDEN